MQFSPGSGIFLASDHTGMEEVEFGFTHGSFQTDQEPVVKIRHVINAVFVNDKGTKQAAQLKELHKVSRGAGKA